MHDIDELIGRALSDEDRALLARHAEPGYLSQAMGVFRGPLGWVSWLTYVLGVLAFLGAAFALWQALAAGTPLAAVKWGVGALFLFQFAAVTKNYLGAHFESNRMLREIKRVELQLALLRAETGAAAR
jgi:hypothetical protein